jgi:hypothetical protein
MHVKRDALFLRGWAAPRAAITVRMLGILLLSASSGASLAPPNYDGVKRDAKEPAVIALFGIAPVDLTLVDPSKPGWRQV